VTGLRAAPELERVPIVSLPAAPAPEGVLRRTCACGGSTGPDGECASCRARRLRRSPAGSPAQQLAPPIVHEVLRSPGRPLDAAARTVMESRLGHDFGSVRVHTDERAAESAREVSAQAYTVGRDVVFASGRYAPESGAGRSLLLHELTHVVQQQARPAVEGAELPVGPADDTHEREADRIAAGGARPLGAGAPSSLQRLLFTPIAAGGGLGGLMERERERPPYQVCSRDLQGPQPAGLIANHSYVEAPPFRYAVTGPFCPAALSDSMITGTTAQKWDHSPDPCGKSPTCVSCVPKPGVSDVGACLQAEFNAYQSLSLYRLLGPNSNTFSGTLARACCDGMDPRPFELGNCPGWYDQPAPARAGGTPCPAGPSC
jgi:hypothetical protein